MGRYLNLGNAGFASIRRGLYVDKTMLIDFINKTLGTKEKLTCVSRPRRFGKSFATQMLCAYYDKNCDSSELFKDLKIGYLAYDSEKKEVYIPNQEISDEFKNAVEYSGWEGISAALQTSERLLEATIQMDTETVAQELPMTGKVRSMNV